MGFPLIMLMVYRSILIRGYCERIYDYRKIHNYMNYCMNYRENEPKSYIKIKSAHIA